MPRARKDKKCFVVVSHEGCWRGPDCVTAHLLVECEVHGLLGKVRQEDTAQFIMKGHMEQPTWPKPLEPLSPDVLGRIERARTDKGRIFVPSTYRGG